MGIRRLQWIDKFYNDLESKILNRIWIICQELSSKEFLLLKTKMRNLIEEHKKNETKERIVWNGSQKQFAELIVELKNKGWIENNSNKSIATIAKEFAACFDLTGTKKSKSSSEENSFYQLLKPQQSKGNLYENIYPQIYTKRYKSSFKEIKERPKKWI